MYPDATQSASMVLDAAHSSDTDSNVRQTRREYLAGTIAFPTLFPSVGEISIINGRAEHSLIGQLDGKVVVRVQERSSLEHATTRYVLKEDVAAIFFPGEYVDTTHGRVFRGAEDGSVRNLDDGVWLLNGDISANSFSIRLGIDSSRPESGALGIIFVPQNKPVLTVHECTHAAGSAETMSRAWSGCTRC